MKTTITKAWKNYQDNLAKDKKVPIYLAVAMVVGVFLIVVAGSLLRVADGPDDPMMPQATATFAGPETSESKRTQTCESALEARLEEMLSLVDGAGKVRVMITFAQGREKVLAVDRNVSVSTIQEQDAAGGTRYQSSQQSQDQTLIITDRTGENRPLILTETMPVVGGVIIIAEGGDNVLVRDALIRGTSTLLSIDINKVQVMAMRQ